jgi:hypothetical protein
MIVTLICKGLMSFSDYDRCLEQIASTDQVEYAPVLGTLAFSYHGVEPSGKLYGILSNTNSKRCAQPLYSPALILPTI